MKINIEIDSVTNTVRIGDTLYTSEDTTIAHDLIRDLIRMLEDRLKLSGIERLSIDARIKHLDADVTVTSTHLKTLWGCITP